MTAVASLGFDWNVLVHKWALLVGVAFHTNHVAAGHGSDLPDGGCSVNIVAIAARDQTFVNPMVIGPGKVRFRGRMTSVAELGLRLYEEVLGFCSVMRRVAIYAAYVAIGMRGTAEVALFMTFTVATQAASTGILPRHRLEADDFRDIPATFDVR